MAGCGRAVILATSEIVFLGCCGSLVVRLRVPLWVLTAVVFKSTSIIVLPPGTIHKPEGGKPGRKAGLSTDAAVMRSAPVPVLEI